MPRRKRLVWLKAHSQCEMTWWNRLHLAHIALGIDGVLHTSTVNYQEGRCIQKHLWILHIATLNHDDRALSGFALLSRTSLALDSGTLRHPQALSGTLRHPQAPHSCQLHFVRPCMRALELLTLNATDLRRQIATYPVSAIFGD